jgi:hypothetical protein
MTIKAIREMSSFADKFGDIIMPATKKIVPKAPQEFNSLMEYTDNINNNYIAWAGYIHALMKQKGLPFQFTDSPNFNDLNKPFYAIIRQDDNLACPVIASAENQPLKYYLVKCV